MAATARATGPVIAMLTRSAAEEALVAGWVREHHPDATTVRAEAFALSALLREDDREIFPVRVLRLPPTGTPHRLADAVGRVVPAGFGWRGGAAVVVAGEPATCRDIRAAFVAEVGAGPEDLADFVVRRAVLACDRAERRLVGDRYKVPRLMVEQISASARFRSRAAQAAQRIGVGRAEFLARAVASLTEMVAVQSPPAIDALRALTSPMYSRAWSVDVDDTGLDRLRALNRSASLIFLPSHRSYADPFVLAEVLHERDFPRNHMLGGANLSFWPLGTLGRRAGVVFIRRSFGDDAAYKFAFREYLGHLMAKRFNIECYIEGGRTRTGKLRRPKFGLLRYLVDALGDEPEVDAVLVPVSIIYDQLHEVGTMAAEQIGGAKPAEGLRWLARYLRDQRRHIGHAKVRFGDPIPLRAALADAGPGPVQLEKVAFRVFAEINRVTPVMATAVVTFALLDAGDRALTFGQVTAVAEPLLVYLERRGAPAPFALLREPAGLRRTLSELTDAGVVSCYAAGREPVWSIVPGRAHIAAFYRNGAVHRLLNRAIVELALLHAEREGSPQDLGEQGVVAILRLRDLFKFEFFFPDKVEFVADLGRELELLDPDWRRGGPGNAVATKLLDACRTLVAPRAVRSIVEAQLVLAEQLVTLPDGQPLDREAFLTGCLTLGHQMHLQGRITRADAVSRELFDGALRLAVNRDLTGSEGPDLPRRRSAFRREVRDVLDLLTRGELRDAALLEEVLDDHRTVG